MRPIRIMRPGALTDVREGVVIGSRRRWVAIATTRWNLHIPRGVGRWYVSTGRYVVLANSSPRR